MTISKLTVVCRIWINQRNFVKTQVRVRLGRGKSFLWKSKKENVPNWPQDCGLLLIKQDFQRSYGKLRLNILKFDLYTKYSRTYKNASKLSSGLQHLKPAISPHLSPQLWRWGDVFLVMQTTKEGMEEEEHRFAQSRNTLEAVTLLTTQYVWQSQPQS